MSAQKELYNASKYLIEASKAGHEWCGDISRFMY